MRRGSNRQHYKQPIERGEGVIEDAGCWMTDGGQPISDKAKQQSTVRTPKDSHVTLAAWDMGVVCPPQPCTLLYALILNVNPWLDMACKSSSSIWGWSSSRTSSIDWLSCTWHRCSSCTYSVRDLCRHCYYDSHHRHCRNRTDQHRKLGKLKHYYLDEFNQTEVFVRHKRGMWNSAAIEDRRESSFPNNWPLLLCPLLSLDCSEKVFNAVHGWHTLK